MRSRVRMLAGPEGMPAQQPVQVTIRSLLPVVLICLSLMCCRR